MYLKKFIIMQKILLWCHGGCFSGGSVDYDKELREYLNENNWTLLPVDFSLNDWSEAINDITDKVLEFKSDENIKIVLGGISSGALMAHHVANKFNLPALLICPVIKPFDRHITLTPDLKTKQLKFFHTLQDMKKIQDSINKPNNKRYILYGNRDDRAPSSVFQDWLKLEYVFFDVLDKGHEICNNVPLDLIKKQLDKLF